MEITTLLTTSKRLLLALFVYTCTAHNGYGQPVDNAAANAKTKAIGITTATIETNLGTIKVRLNCQAAPITCKNFIYYSNRYFYDGLIFHRVVDNFVIQSGGYWFDYSRKEPIQGPIINESSNGLQNLRGTIGMARHEDPNSARAQFYINLKDNTHLNASADEPGYTVFGQVISGMQVADNIGQTPVIKVSESLTHVPEEAVQIQRITIQEETP